MEIEFDKDKMEEATNNINLLMKQIKKLTGVSVLSVLFLYAFDRIIFLNNQMKDKTVDEKKENIKKWFKLNDDNQQKEIDRLFNLIIFKHEDMNGDTLTKIKDINLKQTNLDQLKKNNQETYETMRKYEKLIIKNIFKVYVDCYTEKHPEEKIDAMELCFVNLDDRIMKRTFFDKITGQKYVENPSTEDEKKAEDEYQQFKAECYKFVYGKNENELNQLINNQPDEIEEDVAFNIILNQESPYQNLIVNLQSELDNGINTRNAKQVIKQIKDYFNELGAAKAKVINILISKGISPKDVLNVNFKDFYLHLNQLIPGKYCDSNPYETAFKYFEVYVGDDNVNNQNYIDIHKLFTGDDLAFLGGEEFIKDCYKKVYRLTNTDQIPTQYLSCKEKPACDIYFTSNILWANAKAFLATGSVALIFILLVLFEVVALASTLAIIIAMSAILLGTIIATIVGYLHTKEHIENQAFNEKLQTGEELYIQYTRQQNEEIYKKLFDKQFDKQKHKGQLLDIIYEEDDRSDEKE
ncbi:MAG: hypothetical protein IJU86_00290 [Firmicutes bacterium]|nr:hypothetical protein [Bacillota bacterium]